MLSIRQTATGWELLRDGEVLTVHVDGTPTVEFARYEDALAALGRLIEQSLVLAAMDGTDAGDEPSSDGLLPEVWESPSDTGVALSADTGDGRVFTDCVWSWRDPNVSVVPLMLQTATEFGHFGAELAGYVTEFWNTDGTVGARGRFYDSETGRAFRDMLLDGRRFGVSVDPGAVAIEEECIELDSDGWCIDYRLNFLSYEIIGVTGTPFPGFAEAAITLGSAAAEADSEPVAASSTTVTACGCAAAGLLTPCGCQSTSGSSLISLSTRAAVGSPITQTRPAARVPVTAAAAPTLTTVDVPLAPPRRWFDDPDFMMPTPLTITREGRVLGHVAVWGTCHTGRLDRCVTPPRVSGFDDFLQGRVFCEDGSEVRTGVLTWQADHPDHALSYLEAMALYGDSFAGWADVVAGQDRHGPWVSGVLRHTLTDGDVRILRALSLSGDWRVSRRTGRHELIGVLAVNYPGFPISAAARELHVAAPRPFASPAVITAAGMVPQSARQPEDDLLARLTVVERRQARQARETLAGLAREQRDRSLARLRG